MVTLISLDFAILEMAEIDRLVIVVTVDENRIMSHVSPGVGIGMGLL